MAHQLWGVPLRRQKLQIYVRCGDSEQAAPKIDEKSRSVAQSYDSRFLLKYPPNWNGKL